MLEVIRIADAPITLTPFLNLVMVWNEGISFGFMHESPYARPVFIATSSLITLFLGVWMARSPHRYERIAFALIIGGAVGNIIDRIRFGAVADFFDFHILDYHWPAFNIADSAICIGAVSICIVVILEYRKER